MGEISAIDDWHVQIVSRGALGRHGNVCPFQSGAIAAWKEVDKRTKPNNVRQPKARDIFTKHGVYEFDRSAAVKVGLRGPWKRKPYTNPDS